MKGIDIVYHADNNTMELKDAPDDILIGTDGDDYATYLKFQIVDDEGILDGFSPYVLFEVESRPMIGLDESYTLNLTQELLNKARYGKLPFMLVFKGKESTIEIRSVNTLSLGIAHSIDADREVKDDTYHSELAIKYVEITYHAESRLMELTDMPSDQFVGTDGDDYATYLRFHMDDPNGLLTGYGARVEFDVSIKDDNGDVYKPFIIIDETMSVPLIQRILSNVKYGAIPIQLAFKGTDSEGRSSQYYSLNKLRLSISDSIRALEGVDVNDRIDLNSVINDVEYNTKTATFSFRQIDGGTIAVQLSDLSEEHFEVPTKDDLKKLNKAQNGDTATTLDDGKWYKLYGEYSDPQSWKVMSPSVKAVDDHISDRNNPHNVTKTQIGLGNVDDTSDIDKPISTATQEALDTKADAQELSELSKIVSKEIADRESSDSAINESISAHVSDTNNPHNVTKEQLGLENVDNTSDADKPISTATQSAIDGKVSKSGDTMSGNLTIQNASYRELSLKNTSIPKNYEKWKQVGIINGKASDGTIGQIEFLRNTPGGHLGSSIQLTSYNATGGGKYLVLYSFDDGVSQEAYVQHPSWMVGTNDNSDKSLTIKMANSLPSLCHTSGNESWSGTKTFNTPPIIGGRTSPYLIIKSTSLLENLTESKLEYGMITFRGGDDATNLASLVVSRSTEEYRSRWFTRHVDSSGKEKSVAELVLRANKDGTSWVEATTTPSDATGNQIATANWVNDKFSALPKVYRPCGSVATFDQLPTNASIGDVYNVESDNQNYAWVEINGVQKWDSLGATIDLTQYYTKTDVDGKLSEVRTIADGKVSKSGDTMTGELRIYGTSAFATLINTKANEFSKFIHLDNTNGSTEWVGVTQAKKWGTNGSQVELIALDRTTSVWKGIYIQNDNGTCIISGVTPSSTSDNSTKLSTTAWINSADVICRTVGNQTIAGEKTFTSVPKIRTWAQMLPTPSETSWTKVARMTKSGSAINRYCALVEINMPYHKASGLLRIWGYGGTGITDMGLDWIYCQGFSPTDFAVNFETGGEGVFWIKQNTSRSQIALKCISQYNMYGVDATTWEFLSPDEDGNRERVTELPTTGKTVYSTSPAVTTPSDDASGTEVVNAKWSLGKFLKKSGDTMDGILYLTKDTTIYNEKDTNTIPTAYENRGSIYFRDLNNVNRAVIRCDADTSYTRTYFSAERFINGVSKIARFDLRIQSDGRMVAYAPSPRVYDSSKSDWVLKPSENTAHIATCEWVNVASSVVHTAGNEDISGLKRFKDNIILQHATTRSITFRDSNSTDLGYLSMNSSNNIFLKTNSGTITLESGGGYVNSTGNLTVAKSTPIISCKDTEVDLTTRLTTARNIASYTVHSKSNVYMGGFINRWYTDGSHRTNMEAVGETGALAQLNLYANADGTMYATAPSWSVGTNDNSDKILTMKMANSLPSLVHTIGNETIDGLKVFSSPIKDPQNDLIYFVTPNSGTASAPYYCVAESTANDLGNYNRVAFVLNVVVHRYGDTHAYAKIRVNANTGANNSLSSVNLIMLEQNHSYQSTDPTSWMATYNTAENKIQLWVKVTSDQFSTYVSIDTSVSRYGRGSNWKLISPSGGSATLPSVDEGWIHVPCEDRSKDKFVAINGSNAMTGNLTLNLKDPRIEAVNTLYTKGTAPSGTRYWVIGRMHDNNISPVMSIEGTVLADERRVYQFATISNNDVWQYPVKIVANSDNSGTYMVCPTPASKTENSTQVATTSWINSADIICRTAGNQTVGGTKTFTSPIHITTNSYAHAYIFNKGANVNALSQWQIINALYFYGTDGTNDVQTGGYFISTDGQSNPRTVIQTRRLVDGENKVGEITLVVKSNGTSYATCPTPSSDANEIEIVNAGWSIGKFVQKSGDTMTGTLKVAPTGTTPRIDLIHPNFELSTIPTANCFWDFEMCDKNGKRVGLVEGLGSKDSSARQIGFCLNISTDPNTESWQRLQLYNDGNGSYGIAPTPTNKSSNSTAIATTSWINSADVICRTVGNQTIAGTKTFTSNILHKGTNGSLNFYNERASSDITDDNGTSLGGITAFRRKEDASDGSYQYAFAGNIVYTAGATYNRMQIQVRRPDGTTTNNAYMSMYNYADGTRYLSIPKPSDNAVGTEAVTASWVNNKLAGKVTISTADPSGGSNGDIWFKYE